MTIKIHISRYINFYKLFKNHFYYYNVKQMFFKNSLILTMVKRKFKIGTYIYFSISNCVLNTFHLFWQIHILYITTIYYLYKIEFRILKIVTKLQ